MITLPQIYAVYVHNKTMWISGNTSVHNKCLSGAKKASQVREKETE
jgi:hypothetical protein